MSFNIKEKTERDESKKALLNLNDKNYINTKQTFQNVKKSHFNEYVLDSIYSLIETHLTAYISTNLSTETSIQHLVKTLFLLFITEKSITIDKLKLFLNQIFNTQELEEIIEIMNIPFYVFEKSNKITNKSVKVKHESGEINISKIKPKKGDSNIKTFKFYDNNESKSITEKQLYMNSFDNYNNLNLKYIILNELKIYNNDIVKMITEEIYYNSEEIKNDSFNIEYIILFFLIYTPNQMQEYSYLWGINNKDKFIEIGLFNSKAKTNTQANTNTSDPVKNDIFAKIKSSSASKHSKNNLRNVTNRSLHRTNSQDSIIIEENKIGKISSKKNVTFLNNDKQVKQGFESHFNNRNASNDNAQYKNYNINNLQDSSLNLLTYKNNKNTILEAKQNTQNYFNNSITNSKGSRVYSAIEENGKYKDKDYLYKEDSLVNLFYPYFSKLKLKEKELRERSIFSEDEEDYTSFFSKLFSSKEKKQEENQKSLYDLYNNISFKNTVVKTYNDFDNILFYSKFNGNCSSSILEEKAKMLFIMLDYNSQGFIDPSCKHFKNILKLMIYNQIFLSDYLINCLMDSQLNESNILYPSSVKLKEFFTNINEYLFCFNKEVSENILLYKKLLFFVTEPETMKEFINYISHNCFFPSMKSNNKLLKDEFLLAMKESNYDIFYPERIRKMLIKFILLGKQDQAALFFEETPKMIQYFNSLTENMEDPTLKCSFNIEKTKILKMQEKILFYEKKLFNPENYLFFKKFKVYKDKKILSDHKNKKITSSSFTKKMAFDHNNKTHLMTPLGFYGNVTAKSKSSGRSLYRNHTSNEGYEKTNSLSLDKTLSKLNLKVQVNTKSTPSNASTLSQGQIGGLTSTFNNNNNKKYDFFNFHIMNDNNTNNNRSQTLEDTKFENSKVNRHNVDVSNDNKEILNTLNSKNISGGNVVYINTTLNSRMNLNSLNNLQELHENDNEFYDDSKDEVKDVTKNRQKKFTFSQIVVPGINSKRSINNQSNKNINTILKNKVDYDDKIKRNHEEKGDEDFGKTKANHNTVSLANINFLKKLKTNEDISINNDSHLMVNRKTSQSNKQLPNANIKSGENTNKTNKYNSKGRSNTDLSYDSNDDGFDNMGELDNGLFRNITPIKLSTPDRKYNESVYNKSKQEDFNKSSKPNFDKRKFSSNNDNNDEDLFNLALENTHLEKSEYKQDNSNTIDLNYQKSNEEDDHDNLTKEINRKKLLIKQQANKLRQTPNHNDDESSNLFIKNENNSKSNISSAVSKTIHEKTFTVNTNSLESDKLQSDHQISPLMQTENQRLVINTKINTKSTNNSKLYKNIREEDEHNLHSSRLNTKSEIEERSQSFITDLEMKKTKELLDLDETVRNENDIVVLITDHSNADGNTNKADKRDQIFQNTENNEQNINFETKFSGRFGAYSRSNLHDDNYLDTNDNNDTNIVIRSENEYSNNHNNHNNHNRYDAMDDYIDKFNRNPNNHNENYDISNNSSTLKKNSIKEVNYDANNDMKLSNRLTNQSNKESIISFNTKNSFTSIELDDDKIKDFKLKTKLSTFNNNNTEMKIEDKDIIEINENTLGDTQNKSILNRNILYEIDLELQYFITNYSNIHSHLNIDDQRRKLNASITIDNNSNNNLKKRSNKDILNLDLTDNNNTIRNSYNNALLNNSNTNTNTNLNILLANELDDLLVSYSVSTKVLELFTNMMNKVNEFNVNNNNDFKKVKLMSVYFFEKIMSESQYQSAMSDFDFEEFNSCDNHGSSSFDVSIIVPIIFRDFSSKEIDHRIFFAHIIPVDLKIVLFDPSDYLMLKDGNFTITSNYKIIFENFFKYLISIKILKTRFKYWDIVNDHHSCGLEDEANVISLYYIERIILNKSIDEKDESGEVIELEASEISQILFLKLSEFNNLCVRYSLNK